MNVVKTIKEMQEAAEALRREGKTIGFVPTMGYLHQGHLALVRRAREIADVVVVSIFVNPIQFGPKEDLARYPRGFERDRALLEEEKTDVIFYPDASEMYPDRYSTYIEVRDLQDHLCGLFRPGHFTGVATVVAKLFNAVKPHFAVFGTKDYQQLKVIERMVRDLNMDVRIVPYETVREKDGLAMSSRNTYLSPDEREKSLLIHESIKRLKDLVRHGERDAFVLKEEARKVLGSAPGLDIEYLNICDPDTLEDIDRIEKAGVYAVALRVGKTRLIDNTTLTE